VQRLLVEWQNDPRHETPHEENHSPDYACDNIFFHNDSSIDDEISKYMTDQYTEEIGKDKDICNETWYGFF
jgi:hypothetical protein